jgi:hypothetical protein
MRAGDSVEKSRGGGDGLGEHQVDADLVAGEGGEFDVLEDGCQAAGRPGEAKDQQPGRIPSRAGNSD